LSLVRLGEKVEILEMSLFQQEAGRCYVGSSARARKEERARALFLPSSIWLSLSGIPVSLIPACLLVHPGHVSLPARAH